MSNFELAMRRIEQGHRVKFYQDFYGRQLVKVHGGMLFWRTRSITLRNEEVIELKRVIARKRQPGVRPISEGRQEPDAA